jgi:hypothetical protein
MTDGKSNRGSIQTGVTACDSNNVSIIAVGIGDGISEAELLSIVSEPRYYINTTYMELHESLLDIVTSLFQRSHFFMERRRPPKEHFHSQKEYIV